MISSLSTDLRKIGSFGRRFLLFNAFNTIAWQCLVGSVLVLFARRIDMPPPLVGMLLSFMPLSMVLAFFSIPLIDAIGPRKVMWWGWLFRTLATTPVFLMPWAISRWGMHAGWLVLCFSTLGFCLCRALSAGAWAPWQHEMLPPDSLGVYYSIEQVMYQAVNIVLAFIIGAVLGASASIERFLSIEFMGIAAGIFSLYLISLLPGGRSAERPAITFESFSTFNEALQNRRFMRFIRAGSLGLCAMAWLTSANVLYMRDVLHYSPRHIMFLLGFGGVGIATAVGRWGKFADSHGSGRTMALTLTGFSGGSMLWLLLVPGAPWTNILVWPATAITLIFFASYNMACNRGMLCQLPEGNRAVYSSLWLIGPALSFGITPIIVGQVIGHFGEGGYRFCFIMAVITSLVSAAICRRVREDDLQPQTYRQILLGRAQPWRTFRRILAISLGQWQ